MPRLKNQTLSIRTTAEVKDILRQAAARERRSVASMIEVLVLNYARDHGIEAGVDHQPEPKKTGTR